MTTQSENKKMENRNDKRRCYTNQKQNQQKYKEMKKEHGNWKGRNSKR